MAEKKQKGSVKRAFAQSTYITAGWNWFMILAGKAAEPVLVASVLYASVKLLPIVHFPPQLDVVVFVAQFIALDIGGLSLNKLADQAKADGNLMGATQAKRLSIALVIVMLIGVIMAGLDQIVKLDGQVGTVIDTILVMEMKDNHDTYLETAQLFLALRYYLSFPYPNTIGSLLKALRILLLACLV